MSSVDVWRARECSNFVSKSSPISVVQIFWPVVEAQSILDGLMEAGKERRASCHRYHSLDEVEPLLSEEHLQVDLHFRLIEEQSIFLGSKRTWRQSQCFPQKIAWTLMNYLHRTLARIPESCPVQYKRNEFILKKF